MSVELKPASSTLKMETTCSSEMLVITCKATGPHNPQGYDPDVIFYFYKQIIKVYIYIHVMRTKS
jgi:hypothetical protein